MKSPHEFGYPKVTEIVRVKPQIEHDNFIDGLSVPQKLAQVIDLNRNVVEVDFSRGKSVA